MEYHPNFQSMPDSSILFGLEPVVVRLPDTTTPDDGGGGGDASTSSVSQGTKTDEPEQKEMEMNNRVEEDDRVAEVESMGQLSYSAVVHGSSPALGSVHTVASKRRPHPVKLPPADSSSFPTLEEAKVHASYESKRERRRRSSAANRGPLPKEHEGQANKEKDVVGQPLQEEAIQVAGEKAVEGGQTGGNSRDETEPNTQNTDECEKPSVIAQLMSKLVLQDGNNHGLAASSATIAGRVPLSAHSHPHHAEGHSSTHDISRQMPDTITYYYPRPKISDVVPDSAPLVSTTTTTSQPFPSNSPGVSFLTPQTPPSRHVNSVPPPPKRDFFEAAAPSSTDNFGGNSAAPQLERPTPVCAPDNNSNGDIIMSRQNAEIEGIIMGGPSLSPTRQGTFATRANPEIVEPQRMIPSMYGVVGNTALSNIPGTPTFRNMPLTASQAEQQQRIAAIWRDSGNSVPYSPSVYDAPGPGDYQGGGIGHAGHVGEVSAVGGDAEGGVHPLPPRPPPAAGAPAPAPAQMAATSAPFVPNPLAAPHIPSRSSAIDVQGSNGNSNLPPQTSGPPPPVPGSMMPPPPPPFTRSGPEHGPGTAPTGSFTPAGAPPNSAQHSGFVSPVDQSNNAGPPPHTANGGVTSPAPDFAALNNLVHFLTEKVIYSIGSSRELLLDNFIRRVDMLYYEVQSLRADNHHQTERLAEGIAGLQRSLQAENNRLLQRMDEMESRLAGTPTRASDLREDAGNYQTGYNEHGAANSNGVAVEQHYDNSVTASEADTTVPTPTVPTPTAAFRTPEGRTANGENSEATTGSGGGTNNVVGGINTGSPRVMRENNGPSNPVVGGVNQQPPHAVRAPIPQYNFHHHHHPRGSLAGRSNGAQGTGNAAPTGNNAGGTPQTAPEPASPSRHHPPRAPASFYPRGTTTPIPATTGDHAGRQHQPANPVVAAGQNHRRGPSTASSAGGCTSTFNNPPEPPGQRASSQVTGTTWGGTSNWYRRAYPTGREE